MLDIRIDDNGELRCWNCGSKGFKSKRTLRSKAIVGAGAAAAGAVTFGMAAGVVGAATPLITKKKLKCEACGKYNDTGNAKPYQPDVVIPVPQKEYQPRSGQDPEQKANLERIRAELKAREDAKTSQQNKIAEEKQQKHAREKELLLKQQEFNASDDPFNLTFRPIAQLYKPLIAKGIMSKMIFDGVNITIKTPIIGKKRIVPIEQITGIHIILPKPKKNVHSNEWFMWIECLENPVQPSKIRQSKFVINFSGAVPMEWISWKNLVESKCGASA